MTNYGAYQNPLPPKPGSSGGKTVTGQMRAISYLWDTTVPGNKFGTDGPTPSVPSTWQGDHWRNCRQWHGVNLTATFRNDGSIDPASILVDELAYSGSTNSAGLVGKTTVTDRHVTEPRIGKNALGSYVEIKSLLGTRLGAFVPKLNLTWAEIGAIVATIVDPDLTPLVFDDVFSAIVKLIESDTYVGTNSFVPKIFTYASLRIYASGPPIVNWVSSKRGNGYVTQAEIIEGENKQQFGASWIPEHHLYSNGYLLSSLSLVPAGDHTSATEQWIDSNRPFDQKGFEVLSAALAYWAEHTPLKVKQAVADNFRDRYPDYFIGTKFK